LDKPNNEKKCAKCNEIKQLSEFNKDSHSSSGVFCWCKICTRAYRKEKRQTQIINLSQSDIERFNKYVVMDMSKGYLVWKGAKDTDGYGVFNIKERQLKAHRVAWMIKNGPIPEGLCILHETDDPECVDTNYLSLGTIADNNMDKKVKKRGIIGERNGMVTLSEDQVIQVINLRKSGLTYEKIASEIGISLSGVHHICSGYTWSHLTGIPCCR
jgi:hypothetical protein